MNADFRYHNLRKLKNYAIRGPPTGIWTALNNSGADARVAIAPPLGAITILDARLFVPPAQPGGAYNGTVILTFGNQV